MPDPPTVPAAEVPMTPPVVPARLEKQARLMRRVNVVMRPLLRLPFPTPLSRRLMLLSYTGRKSGRAYLQPVSFVPDGDVLLTPGGGRWKLNLRAGEPISVRLRGRRVLARPEFVRDADEVDRLLRHMLGQNARLASFVPFLRADGTTDRATLEQALARGFCVVRWTIERPSRTR
ncbi:MAG TPA: hypothetical protein VHT75_17120 [Acidimicrobiales bacterium]|nr:hypothetical protein [Acidimicrobiales bacterium]